MRTVRSLPLIAVTLLLALACCAGEETQEPGTADTSNHGEPGEAGAVQGTAGGEVEMDMVLIPGGSFLMGSGDTDPDAVWNELPAHTVILKAFLIGRTEVTNAQYRKCVDAGDCRAAQCWDNDEYSADNQPVVCVRWWDARDFCNWAYARMPTEAEWEYAARGDDGRLYPWGDEQPDCTLANVSGCGGRTSAVGSYPAGASPDGALDMAGNVFEWVMDYYDGAYYAVSPATNPEGPLSGEERVLRGGSYLSDAAQARSTVRTSRMPDEIYLSWGFRCARSAKGGP